jgi:hypothetical protein
MPLKWFFLSAMFCFTLFLPTISPLAGQTDDVDLSIVQEDLSIEQGADGGFHLFIKRKPGVGSVLLTETTRDPALVEANYAYRITEWNAVNGDEMRLINGIPITRDSGIFSLVDSTPEMHPELGEVFHIYIPYLLYYGYEHTRHGELYVVNGTFFNIRSFVLPYADYRQPFKDNPFVLKVTQKPLEGPPDGNYMKDTISAFTHIALDSGGSLLWSSGPSDLVEKIRDILEQEKGKAVDLVICLDTTASMRNDIAAIREQLPSLLRDFMPDFTAFRIGLALYKDYDDVYLTRVVAFTEDMAQFERSLRAIIPGGGKDIPEAVYESLYDAATKFPWKNASRIIILIGDAPPHPRQRGKVSKKMVDQAIQERGVVINAIILPQ